MDPLNAQHKEMTSHSLENTLVWSKAQQARKPRPQPEQALKCPRCDSANTKFCYYNNYSLSQPRYFCKSCRRYWTKGGTLRNVPGGGSCRKNKRSSSASSSKSTQDIQPLTPSSDSLPGLPASSYEYSDLTLALTRLRKQTCEQLGYDDHQRDLSFLGKPSQSDILGNNGMATSAYTNTVFIDALRSGVLETQNNNLYYGFGEDDYGNGVGIRGSVEMMLPNYDQETSNATTQAVTVTTVKHELCNGREQSDNRISWGSPWLFNGEGNIDKLDSGRETWNSFTSSWHGLLNTPNVDTATPSTQNGRKKLNFSVC